MATSVEVILKTMHFFFGHSI